MERLVTVISQRSSKKVTFNTEVNTWSQLKDQIEKNGISTNNMIANVKETHTSLVHSEAMLPEGSFTIFLFSQKQKGGTSKSVTVVDKIMTKKQEKEVERLKAEAKKAGVKLTVKVSMSDPTYYRKFMAAYDKAMNNTTTPKPTPAPAESPKTKTVAKAGKSVPATKYPITESKTSADEADMAKFKRGTSIIME